MTYSKIKKLVGVFILAFMFMPLAIAILAGTTAYLLGCTLNEGTAYQCIAFGSDIGIVLYKMSIFGWHIFATVPIGLVLICVIMISEIIARKQLPNKDNI